MSLEFASARTPQRSASWRTAAWRGVVWRSAPSRGRGGCVSVVPRRRVREQDAHPRARGRGLEPVGRLEHVQPYVWDGSPLPAEEM